MSQNTDNKKRPLSPLTRNRGVSERNAHNGVIGDRRFLSQPWQAPSLDAAIKRQSAQLFDQGQAKFCARNSSVDSLGAGVGLHFRLVWYFAVFFSIALLFALPSLLLSFVGSRLSSEELDPLRLSRLSIANVGDRSSWENYTAVVISSSNIKYTARQISGIITAMDFCYMVLFMGMIAFLWGRIRNITERIESNVVSARDYSVFVTGLPRKVTEEQVRAHFDKLYNLREPDWTYASSCKECFCNRKSMRRRMFGAAPPPPSHWALPLNGPSDQATDKPANGLSSGHKSTDFVLMTSANPSMGQPGAPALTKNARVLNNSDVYPVYDENDPYQGSWVADVALAYANGGLIKRYQALSGLFRRIRLAQVTAQKYNTGSKFADVRRKEAALKQLDRLEKSLQHINKKYSKEYSDTVVGAYVTFNNEESLKRCLEDYATSGASLQCCCYSQPAPLQFASKRLKVRRAPDPSQIVWENLELSSSNKCCRQTSIGLVLLMLLAISFLFIMLAQAYQSKFRSNVPNLGLCNTLLPAVAFGKNVTAKGALADIANNTLPTGLSLLRDPTDSTCSAKYMSRIHWTSTTAAPILSSVNTTDPCYDECFSSDSTAGSCVYPAGNAGTVSFARKDVVACYCISRLRALIDSKGLFTGLRSLISDDGKFCFDSATDYISFNALVIIASAVVVFINTVLASMLKAIAALEGHADLDAVHKSIAFKVFLALFLNTACLVLIINAALPGVVSNIQVGEATLFSGKYASFDVRWHTTVGVSIVLTMILNSLSVHWKPAYFLLCVKPCQKAGAESVPTQDELDKRFTPPEWQFPVRVAAVMNTFFTCLMYSAGHPILLAVGAGSFFLAFLIDRWTLLRIFRRPPRYDNAMALFSMKLIPFAIVIHLLFAIWMYSDPLVLYSPSYAGLDTIEVVQQTATAVDDTIGGFSLSSLTKSSVGMDVVRRLSRENTLPLFLLLSAFCFVWFFTTTIGKALLAFVRYVLCCGQCERLYTCACGDRVLIKRRPPYTGPFEAALRPKMTHTLNAREIAAGIRFWREPYGQYVKIFLFPLKEDKVAARSGAEPHFFGERMRTVEVIGLQAVSDYHIESNPAYRAAVLAIQAARNVQLKKVGSATPNVMQAALASARSFRIATAKDVSSNGSSRRGELRAAGNSTVPLDLNTTPVTFENPMPKESSSTRADVTEPGHVDTEVPEAAPASAYGGEYPYMDGYGQVNLYGYGHTMEDQGYGYGYGYDAPYAGETGYGYYDQGYGAFAGYNQQAPIDPLQAQAQYYPSAGYPAYGGMPYMDPALAMMLGSGGMMQGQMHMPMGVQYPAIYIQPGATPEEPQPDIEAPPLDPEQGTVVHQHEQSNTEIPESAGVGAAQQANSRSPSHADDVQHSPQAATTIVEL